MQPLDDSQLVRAWIAMVMAEDGTPECEKNRWAGERVWEMCKEDPDRAWKFVLDVLAADRSSCVIGRLAAGPVEDLLANHPYKTVERVEIEARKDQQFASLLGGVWQNKMPDDVWQRVQAVWDRRGWDGIPRPVQ